MGVVCAALLRGRGEGRGRKSLAVMRGLRLVADYLGRTKTKRVLHRSSTGAVQLDSNQTARRGVRYRSLSALGLLYLSFLVLVASARAPQKRPGVPPPGLCFFPWRLSKVAQHGQIIFGALSGG